MRAVLGPTHMGNDGDNEPKRINYAHYCKRPSSLRKVLRVVNLLGKTFVARAPLETISLFWQMHLTAIASIKRSSHPFPFLMFCTEGGGPLCRSLSDPSPAPLSLLFHSALIMSSSSAPFPCSLPTAVVSPSSSWSWPSVSFLRRSSSHLLGPACTPSNNFAVIYGLGLPLHLDFLLK